MTKPTETPRNHRIPDSFAWDSHHVEKVERKFGLQKHVHGGLTYASSVPLKRMLEAAPDQERIRTSEAKVHALPQDWKLMVHEAHQDAGRLDSAMMQNADYKETSLSCVALLSQVEAGGNSRPTVAMDHFDEQVSEFWQRQAWAGVIASESLLLCEDVEDSEIKALYQYMPVQSAAHNMFDPAEFPYLRELCTLRSEGLGRLMPDGSRGRKHVS